MLKIKILKEFLFTRIIHDVIWLLIFVLYDWFYSDVI